MAENLCECGSGVDYLHCCGPYHQNTQSPATCEALLRSRYCAYVREYNDYINRTWHPSTRPQDAISHNPELRWMGLEILSQQGGGGLDAKGEIEFIAKYTISGRPEELHERSQFVREAGQWLYLDGEGLAPRTVVSDEKIGRNDPCPCGSGKKYKKCCGAS